MTAGPKLAALAVVLHQGRVLLVRRRNEPDAGLWGYPGGHVNLGETALAAAARELLEETGVIANPRGYLQNLDIVLRDDSGGLRHHFFLVAVVCAYQSGEPVGQDDVSEARWVAFDKVIGGALPMSDNVDTVLRAALKRQD